MGIAPLVFSGISKFSQDFQTIVSRTVAIASLPVNALRSDQEDALATKTALIDLKLGVSDLAASLKRLGSLGDANSLGLSSSSTKVGATITDTSVAAPGVYQITEIASLATRASATSTVGVADAAATPVAGDPYTMRLLVGTREFDFTLAPGENTLEGIKTRINALGAGVTANILNTGDPSAPYFLSVTSVAAGAAPIELRTAPGDPASNLLTQTSPGSNAVFKVNGQTVSSTANVVTGVIPGVTLKLLGTTQASESVTVELEPSVSPIASEIRSFVSAYNALSDRMSKHTGEGAGALSGDSLLNSIRSDMRGVFAPLGSGAVQGLAELGITVDNDGVMRFNESALTSASATKIGDILSFLSTTSGLGSLAARFEQYSNPVSGLIDQRMSSLNATDRRLQQQIETMTQRINAMQTTLLARLQAADALLARLESQQGMLDAATESLNFTVYGRKNG